MTIDLPGVRADLMKVIELLHAMIRDDEVTTMIPVDVADYRHLADDPRVLLVGHRGLVSVVAEEGLRVSYQHRRDPLPDDEAKRLVERVTAHLEAALA